MILYRNFEQIETTNNQQLELKRAIPKKGDVFIYGKHIPVPYRADVDFTIYRWVVINPIIIKSGQIRQWREK